MFGFLIVLSVIGTACTQAADVVYCEEKFGLRAEIDFSKKIIRYHEGSFSDQSAVIIPCNGSPRNCFVGEISYFNPFTVEASDYPMPAEVTVAPDGTSRDVEIEADEFQFHYRQANPNDMPSKIEVFRKYDSEHFKYELCHA